MRAKDVSFTEEVVPFDFESGNPAFRTFSPSMKVPVLRHGDLTVWDSLAIMEYVADLYPERGFWPEDLKARALARAISAEMHSGFTGLRGACPMNFRKPAGHLDVSDDVRADVARILNIWRQCIETSGGPFLFGDFTIADAMYAPVVSRLATYQLTSDPVADQYGNAMRGTEAWQEWEAAALKETWIVPVDEV